MGKGGHQRINARDMASSRASTERDYERWQKLKNNVPLKGLSNAKSILRSSWSRAGSLSTTARLRTARHLCAHRGRRDQHKDAVLEHGRVYDQMDHRDYPSNDPAVLHWRRPGLSILDVSGRSGRSAARPYALKAANEVPMPKV